MEMEIIDIDTFTNVNKATLRMRKRIAALILRVREYKVPGARQLTSNYNANCTAVANEDFC